MPSWVQNQDFSRGNHLREKLSQNNCAQLQTIWTLSRGIAYFRDSGGEEKKNKIYKKTSTGERWCLEEGGPTDTDQAFVLEKSEAMHNGRSEVGLLFVILRNPRIHGSPFPPIPGYANVLQHTLLFPNVWKWRKYSRRTLRIGYWPGFRLENIVEKIRHNQRPCHQPTRLKSMYEQTFRTISCLLNGAKHQQS